MNASPVHDSDGNVVPHLFQIGGQAPVQADPQEAAPSPVQPVIKAPAPATAKPRTTNTILAELRERLREVEREIKARKALEAERDSLRRLIAAAKSEKDNVRRLRAAG